MAHSRCNHLSPSCISINLMVVDWILWRSGSPSKIPPWEKKLKHKELRAAGFGRGGCRVLTGRSYRRATRHHLERESFRVECRGTSLMRNSDPLGPYCRTMPRALWWPWGGELIFMSEVPLNGSGFRVCARIMHEGFQGWSFFG